MWDQLASAWNVVGEAAASATESLLEGAGAVADEAGRMAQATKLHAEIGKGMLSINAVHAFRYGFSDKDIFSFFVLPNPMIRSI